MWSLLRLLPLLRLLHLLPGRGLDGEKRAPGASGANAAATAGDRLPGARPREGAEEAPAVSAAGGTGKRRPSGEENCTGV